MANNVIFCSVLLFRFLISDPRGLVSAPLMYNTKDQPLSSRMMLFTGDGRLRSKPEPAVVSHIKLKLATSTEMKNPEGVKQWLIALAKALATQGLDRELHQLCEDLLGPTHSAAMFSGKWVPTIIVRECVILSNIYFPTERQDFSTSLITYCRVRWTRGSSLDRYYLSCWKI